MNTETVTAPGWAKAVILATCREWVGDTQTDYFHTTDTGPTLILAWSKHKRDLFSEMRKAALNAPETASTMGPGKDRYTPRVIIDSPESVYSNVFYHAGWYSPWHPELDGRGDHVFPTLAEAETFTRERGEPESMQFGDQVVTFRWDISRESIEHREKYSMGHGYYLAEGSGYQGAGGWEIAKSWLPTNREITGIDRLAKPA